MRNKQFLNYFVFIFFLLFLPLLVNRSVGAETDDTEAVSGYAPQWGALEPITTLSSAPNGAVQPVVASAPDGSTVMIAFDRNRNSGGVSDPYYRVSTDNGATWGGTAQPIYTSVVNSAAVDIAYDSGSQAHATWVEADAEILYARQSGSGWADATTVNQFSPFLIATPQLFATGSSTIDLVWVQNNQAEPSNPPNQGNNDIYHARSTDDGGIWIGASKSIFESIVESSTPDIYVQEGAIPQNDIIHIVWAEQNFTLANQKDIYYIVSKDGGDSWSNRVNISNFGGNVNLTDARSPKITITSNILRVTFTELFEGTDKERQFVHHISCPLNSDCTKIINWVSDGSVSGQVLGANDAAPRELLSGIATINNCTMIYFHGTINNAGTANEQLFGTSSCGGGAWGDRETVTQDDVQTLRPNLAVQNNWWIYMTFEQVAGSNKSQIYFLRNKPALYLPIIQR